MFYLTYPCPLDTVVEREDKNTVVERKMETRREIFSPAAGGIRNTNTVRTAPVEIGKMTLVVYKVAAPGGVLCV